MQFNLGRAVGRSARPPSSKAKARSNLPPLPPSSPTLLSRNQSTGSRPTPSPPVPLHQLGLPASVRANDGASSSRRDPHTVRRASLNNGPPPPGPSSSVSHNPSSPRLAPLPLSSGLKPDSWPSFSQVRAQNDSSLDRGTHRWLSSADLSWRPPSSKLPFASPPSDPSLPTLWLTLALFLGTERLRHAPVSPERRL